MSDKQTLDPETIFLMDSDYYGNFKLGQPIQNNKDVEVEKYRHAASILVGCAICFTIMTGIMIFFSSQQSLLLIFGLFFLALAGLSWWGLIVIIATYKRHVKIYKDGIVILGHINSAGWEIDNIRHHIHYNIRITFDFVTPQGKTITNETRRELKNGRFEYENRQLPRGGTPVAINYVNDKLYEVL